MEGGECVRECEGGGKGGREGGREGGSERFFGTTIRYVVQISKWKRCENAPFRAATAAPVPARAAPPARRDQDKVRRDQDK
eukprot:720360-Rhodomonas_salina.1